MFTSSSPKTDRNKDGPSERLSNKQIGLLQFAHLHRKKTSMLILSTSFIYLIILVSFYGQKKPSLSYLQPSTSLNSQVAMKLKRKEWRPGQEIVKQGDVGDFSNGMGGIFSWGWLGW